MTDRKVQKRANPSLGITISPKQLDRDIEEARSSNGAWAALQRYRFNLWTYGDSPWLDADAWDACENALAELQGLPCVAGLDLARKWDVSSLALIFVDGEVRHLRVFCWLPEETARKYRSKIDYHAWAKEGHLTLTEGSVTDYNQILEDCVEIFEKHSIQKLAFDPKYAEELTQNIVMETGCERIEFTQTMPNFARPTKQFEDLVISRQLQHDGNPLLAWQAKHCKVKEDSDANIRPIRPKLGDHRTIDAIVAAVMALSEADGEIEDYYADHELEVI